MVGRTIFSEVQIESVIFLSKSQLFHTAKQFLVVVLTLTSADDLSDARNQTVHSGNGLVVIVQLHVERFDLLRIIGNENRSLEDLLGQITLMLGLQIASPVYFVIEFVVVFLQKLDSLGVGYTAELRIYDMVQTLDQSLVHETVEELHFFRCMLHNVADDIFQHCLSKLHIVLQISESDFRLDHPELCCMAGGVGIFCTEGRSKGVDIAECLCKGLAV